MTTTPPQFEDNSIPKFKSIGQVSIKDLILTIVVFLIILRVSIPFITDLVTHHSETITPSFAITCLVLFQNLVLLKLIHYFVLKKHGLTWKDAGLQPTTLKWCYSAILLALPLMIIVGLVNFGMMQFVDKDFVNPQLQAITPEGFTWTSFIFIMIATGIIAPIAEELTFRGVLLGWLDQRYGKVIAIVISSIFFGSVHGVPMLIPALSVAGIAFALLTYRSKSLWPPIILHATFNMFMTSTLFFVLSQGITIPEA
ncbi:CPBP family intramembrane glutamic endopeptidase [Kiloniella antarctica]|uniref:CPBP family intramembrane glutamic endopeptidase n=1 Tax=Kiloniella antarctica TaxID=1550907 RepID=A0ABW5BNY8_9PROT